MPPYLSDNILLNEGNFISSNSEDIRLVKSFMISIIDSLRVTKLLYSPFISSIISLSIENSLLLCSSPTRSPNFSDKESIISIAIRIFSGL